MDGHGELKIHPNWIRADGRDEVQRVLNEPIRAVHATDGRIVRVHNVEWDGKHLVSLVVHNELGRRIPTALGYHETLMLAEKLIHAAKFQKERMRNSNGKS